MEQFKTFGFSYNTLKKDGELHMAYYLSNGEEYNPDKGDIFFNERIKFPLTTVIKNKLGLAQAIQLLHILCGISYFKTCLPKKIIIPTYDISSEEPPLTFTKDQASFFKTVYEKGLGEFFYRNEIDFRGLIEFPVQDKKTSYIPSPVSSPKGRGRILVPLGGGKDSIVTAHLLKKEGHDITLLHNAKNPIVESIAGQMELPLITVERFLDPLLFELNEKGALNGHIPITAINSTIAIIVALLYGFDTIAMSNEKSANEGNVDYLDTKVNHQWSKSEEFEKMLQNYVHTYINPNLKYYSHLRSMTELEIVKIFCEECEDLLFYAKSCNANWKIGIRVRDSGSWCSKCPKCAFVFALYAAYLPRQTLEHLFEENLFDKEELLPLYKQLLGLEGFKPFECVGTPEEVQEAFQLIHKRGEFEDTKAMKLFLCELRIKN
jgi:UDP-N-acetyl-alpha-D-muramoyl-L-alanyl-L-glutamate epimerase